MVHIERKTWKKLYKAGALLSIVMALCCLSGQTAHAADSGILKFEQGKTATEIAVAIKPTAEMIENKATTVRIRIDISGPGQDSITAVKMAFAKNDKTNIQQCVYDAENRKADIFLSGSDAIFAEGENAVGTLAVTISGEKATLALTPEFIEVADQTRRATKYDSDELGNIQYQAKIDTTSGGGNNGNNGGGKNPNINSGDNGNGADNTKLNGANSRPGKRTKGSKTGDTMNAGIYIIVALLAFAAIAVVVRKRIFPKDKE